MTGDHSRRWPYLLVRGTTATLVLLALAQAVFAGDFLGGRYDALMLHSLTARAMVVVAAGQVIALMFLRRAGGPRSAIPVGLLLTALLVAEFALGATRLTSLHVPLGVLLVVGITQLTASVWRIPLPRPIEAST